MTARSDIIAKSKFLSFILRHKAETEQMLDDGVKFYISDNGVWLVDEIHPKYLQQEQ